MRPPCVFCEDGVERAGKLLKCLHKVCNDCLPASVQEDGRTRCAKCRRPTPCPPPGRNHKQMLVDDSMFDSVANNPKGTVKAIAKDLNLQIVHDENMNPVCVQPDSKSSHTVLSTMTEYQGFLKEKSQG